MTARIEKSGSFEIRNSSSGERLRTYSESNSAPFLLRCGALLIDYTLLVGTLAVSTVLAVVMGGGSRMTGDMVEGMGYLLTGGVAIINLIVLPAWTGKTIGKWATGLRIELASGGPAGIGRTLVRHTVGYVLSLIPFGVGYIIAVFSSQGRALHDYIAGTRVVRNEKRRTRVRR